MRAHVCLAAFIVAGTAAAARATEPPQPVSPGSLTDLAPAASRCPTFTWTTAAGVTGYEIAVYPAEDGKAAAAPPGEPGGPVLHERLPAGAGSWTPAADACLETGVRYAWSVRAERAQGATDWSLPALFEVAPLPDGPETEALVRRVLERLQEAGAADRAERERREREEAKAVLRHRGEVARREASTVRTQSTAPERDRAAAGAASERIGTAANEPVKLAVDGAVQTSRVVFDPPRKIELVVGASSFRPASTTEDDGWTVENDGYGFVPSIPDSVASVALVAPVHGLPGRATIERFSCWFSQPNSTPTATLSFVLRKWAGGSTADALAQVSRTTFVTGGIIGAAFTDTIDFPDVAESGAEYFITGRWDPSAVGPGVRFHGCTINLEVDELSP